MSAIGGKYRVQVGRAQQLWCVDNRWQLLHCAHTLILIDAYSSIMALGGTHSAQGEVNIASNIIPPERGMFAFGGEPVEPKALGPEW